MAEAHRAVSFRNSLKAHETFENVFITAGKSIYRQYELKAHHIKNKFYDGLYPSEPGSWPQIAISVFWLLVFGVDISFGAVRFLEFHVSRYYKFDDIRRRILAVLIFSFIVWISGVLLMKYTLMYLYSYTQWLYEVHSGLSCKTKIWAELVKRFKGKNPSLYSFQSALPRLPLPSVGDTLRRYLLSMEPLLREEEFQRMKHLALNFELNEAPKLQRYLWLKSLWASNYVGDWWERYVYLHARSPLVVNSNIYGLDTLTRHPTRIQAARAAHLISATLNYMLQLVREKITPVLVNDMVPLCMNQYERTFATTRIPGMTEDTLVHFTALARHIVVLHRGRFFKVTLFHSGRWLDEREIERTLQSILDNPSDPADGEAFLAALTAGERTHWAITRKQFFSDGNNADSLTVIEQAAFFVCLEDEDYIPTVLHDQAALDHYASCVFHGNGSNRWFDKSFNLIIGKNGVVGFNAEHSWSDAPVMGHLWETVLTNKTNYDDDGHCRGRSKSTLPDICRLQWDFSQECHEAMKTSLNVALSLINDVDLHVFVHSLYGKGFISRQRLSPDACFQLALQLAYFRDAGSFCQTYEASMTRLFRDGRTETVRSCTNASVAFVKAMEDRTCPVSERLQKLRSAAIYHQTLYRDAMTGKGVDRHLFSLYVVSRHLSIDSPFLQEALSYPWRLSTSQTPHGQTPQVRNLPQFSDLISLGGGFGPVSDDGYGVSYIVASENVTFFHISSMRSCPQTDSTRFASQLADALAEIRSLLT